MAERIRAIRGMNDLLPQEVLQWCHVETVLMNCMQQYYYQEIRLPLVENTQLFRRSIGEITDIVEKEMYTFPDLNGDSLTLRPEGTAGCIRACLEHGLLHNQQQKLWYLGPMFRHERPQKGRYRQFYQFGVEALGFPGHEIELELLALCRRIWLQLEIAPHVRLEINTLGELTERDRYKQVLVDYLSQHHEELDEDSLRRLHKNPLRILDTKNPNMQELITQAPKLTEFLSEKSQTHFHTLCEGLTKLGIPYVINPNLVRGLDYYGHTVFEWASNQLGSQSTVCAGGRYDILVEQLGGSTTPAVGFSIGMERLLLIMQAIHTNRTHHNPFTVYIITFNKKAFQKGMLLAEELRDKHSDWCIISHLGEGSVKSQFKKADKIGANIALIIGDDELRNHQYSIKDLRQSGEQITVAQDQLDSYLKEAAKEKTLCQSI